MTSAPQGGWPAPQAWQQAYPTGAAQSLQWQQYGTQQAPQFPPPGQFAPPQRRRGGGAVRTVVMAVIVIGALFFLAHTVMSMLGTGQGTTTTQTGTTGTSPYANEGYTPPSADLNPPDLPMPDTYSQATTWLEDNPVYAQSIPKPTDCSKVDDIDASTASAGQLTTHLNNLMACLMRVWDPPVTASGDVLPRPSVTVYTRPIQSACGTIDSVNAMYCAADQQVYYARALASALPADLQGVRFVTELVVAHEFGHAVQGRTGILYSEKAWESKSTNAKALNYSRRLEMQADCLAGMFVNSIAMSKNFTDADLQTLMKVVFNLGDDVLSGDPNYVGGHGSGAGRQSWFTTGYNTVDIGQCNTFTVPDSEVK